MDQGIRIKIQTAKSLAIEAASTLRDAAELLDETDTELAGQLRSSAKTIRNAAKRFAV